MPTVVFIVAIVALFATTASATAPLSATATSATEASVGHSNAMPGVALSGGVPSTTLRVSVATDVGTLSMANNPSGLTLATGFTSWSNRSEIAFTGVQSDIDAALATLTLNPGATAGVTAHVQINAQPFVSGMAYSPDNGHYYQFIDYPGATFYNAQTDAPTHSFGGQTGYLASIPSSAINDLIAQKIPGATNVWFGALAVNASNGGDPVQRTWSWTNGPLAGTNILKCSNLTGACAQTGGSWPLAGLWASGEPNNWHNIESAAVTNWSGVPGAWNDLDPNETSIDGYIVEYGNQAVGSSTPFTGTASASASVSVVGPAGSPTGVTASTHGDRATVSWTPPGNTGGRPINSYTATASGGGGSCTVTPPATSCAIEGLTIGGNYTFTVTADNGLGASGASSPSSAVSPTVAVPEPATSPVVSVVDTSSVLVSWTPSTDDGGDSVLYTVVAEPGGFSCTSTGGSCAIGGLAAGREYSFSVVASNSAGSASAVTAQLSMPGGGATASPPPLLTNVRFATHWIRTAKRPASLLAATSARSRTKNRYARGTALYLTSNKAATLRFRVVRDLRGRVKGGRCRARAGAMPGVKRCTVGRQMSVPSSTASVKAGANTLWFSGRIGAKALRPGLYHVIFTLTDADGNVSNTRGDWVRVVRRK